MPWQASNFRFPLQMSTTLELAKALLSRSSVTPHDAGCQQVLSVRLDRIGFECEPMKFGQVSNLWARRRGTAGGKTLVFAGHTDVVSPGPESRWRSPPFEPTVRDGCLFARGSVDMKSAIAAFVVSCEEFVRKDADHTLDLAVLLTSDEEGSAVDGTARVVDELEKRGETLDFCLVGEPTSVELLGDVMKIGRRGSLSGHLIVKGVQGHIAYPNAVLNPVHAVAPALAQLVTERWDDGDADFPPTTFQVSNLTAGSGATNIIPGTAEVKFNFRFSPLSTVEELTTRVENVLKDAGVDYDLRWNVNASPFIKKRGFLTSVVGDVVKRVTGVSPSITTSGGTSDARFLARISGEIVEFGLPGGSAHQLDEHVSVADLEQLKEIYREVLESIVR